MEPREEVLALAGELRRLIRSCETTVGEVSEGLGFHAHQLSHVFRGRRPLRVQLVFDVLRHLRVRPFQFFDLVYPLGGGAELLEREDTKTTPFSPSVAYMESVRRLIEHADGGPMTGEQACVKLRELLKTAIKEAGTTQSKVSRSMGASDSALGHALRGDTELTFLHVFAVLAATGKKPSRLFVELFTKPPRDPIEQLRLRKGLDALENMRTLMSEAREQRKPVQEPASRPSAARAKPKSPGPRKGTPARGGAAKQTGRRRVGR